MFDQCPHKTPAATKTTITSACPKCGTIAKSGKSSCCGRGGSWFKSCGGAGNTRLEHTWYEGINACKARAHFRIAVGQRGNAAQPKGIDSPHGTGKVNFMLTPTPRIPSSRTSITVQGCENLLLNAALHINLLVTIIFQR